MDVNNFIVLSALSLIGSTGVLMGAGVNSILDGAKPPPPRYLELVELSYDKATGEITQQLKVVGATNIRADWSAKIKRGAKTICSGGSKAPFLYDGGRASMPPDVWTGADCPELQHGDVASAQWDWLNEHGFLASVSGTITIDYVTDEQALNQQ